MSTVLIDTHEVVKELVGRDFTEKQAEGVVHAIKSIDLDQVASKADLQELKVDLLKWLVPLLFAQAAFIIALIKLL